MDITIFSAFCLLILSAYVKISFKVKKKCTRQLISTKLDCDTRLRQFCFETVLFPISSEIYFIQWFVADLLTEEWQASGQSLLINEYIYPLLLTQVTFCITHKSAHYLLYWHHVIIRPFFSITLLILQKFSTWCVYKIILSLATDESITDFSE